MNDKGAITGSYRDNSGSHGFVRSPEGIITSFDLPPSENVPISSCNALLPTSINQEGVITGFCNAGSLPAFDVNGWVRYP